MKLTLSVHFPDDYPDDLPELSLDVLEGRLSDEESHSVLEDLYAVVYISSPFYPILSHIA